MKPAYTIWSNASFPANIKEKLHASIGNRLIHPQTLQTLNLAAAPPDPGFFSAEIAFGQPDPAQLLTSEKLRWVHLTTAGYTRYDREDLRKSLRARGIAVTTSSHVYNEPCAQHVLAFLLADSRQLPASHQASQSWPSADLRAKSYLLTGQTVIIYGMGTIARRLVELLAPFHMKIIGIRRHPKGDEPVPSFPIDHADQYLPSADHVINILPANPSTENYFDQKRLTRIKPNAAFYNIGRGTTVDQTSLLTALQTSHLRAAFLDVTDPEPLPPDHPLWTAPNCFITPHTAGGFDGEFGRLADHFLDNLRRFERNEPLLDRVI